MTQLPQGNRTFIPEWVPATPMEPVPFDWHLVPASSRIYNHLLDGLDNYAADRSVLDPLDAQDFDRLRAAARINLEHNALIATHLARQGYDQVLDLGCGLPSLSPSRGPGVHTLVLGVQPRARVIYVDSDPAVIGWRRGTTKDIGVGIVQGDIRDMTTLLASDQVGGRLDLTRPVAILFHDVGPWIDEPALSTALHVLRDWAPVGSALSITHAADMGDTKPSLLTPLIRDAATRHPGADLTYTPRSRDEIISLFGNWQWVAPGLVPTCHWHREHPHHHAGPRQAGAYAGLAIKAVAS